MTTTDPARSSLKTKARILVALTAFAAIFLLDAPLRTQRRSLATNDDLPAGKAVMSTFFEPVPGGCCGMTEAGHTNLVKAWEKAWQSFGWETRILTEADAREHPRFEELDAKLEEADVNPYDRRCFWRWLAMAVDHQGGWMVDYDFFPLTLTSSIGKELASEPGFKSWSIHVPTLIHADHQAWNVMTDKMIDTVDKDLPVPFLTDMYLLEYLHNHHSDKELTISSWERKTYPGFPYKKTGDEITLDCAGARSKLGAHLSHSDTHKAVDAGIFPKVEGVKEGDLKSHMNKRAEAAEVMLSEVRDKCLK